jgi:hypothetical protein
MTNQPFAPRSSAVVSICFCLLALSGCTPKGPPPSQWYAGDSSATVYVPPKQLVSLVQQALAAPPISMPVESVQNGSVTTAWKEERGEFHIIRFWYKRTRFRVNIVPDFDEPTAKSHISVDDQTEERATDRQPWYPAPQLHRPQRSQELLSQITDYVGKHESAQK